MTRPALLPDYWLPRPAAPFTPETRQAFAHLWQEALAADGRAPLAYTLEAPKWQFLCYLSDELGLALHGSTAADIAQFEPRQSNDENPFGNQKAVYAAGDGLWPMFFAITDRERFPMLITNACIRLADPAGQVSAPHYVFSISRTALRQRPWCTGTVYVLPAASFVRQPPIPFGDYAVHVPQLASFEPVTPLARLAVAPDDFPFLSEVRGHDDARWSEYSRALQTAAPWPDP
jgi:hypothetical protein